MTAQKNENVSETRSHCWKGNENGETERVYRIVRGNGGGLFVEFFFFSLMSKRKLRHFF